jgi:hypothetical protein
MRAASDVDTQGDAFFVAFSSAPGAVAAAQAMTEALADGQIHLRIGLHAGTPFVSGEGYVGNDVHLAARVTACGHGGHVLLERDPSARRWALAHRPRGTSAQGHRGSGLDLSAGGQDVPSTQDDLEHEPSPTREFLRGRESSRRFWPSSVMVHASSRSPGRAARERHASPSRPRPNSFLPTTQASSGLVPPPSAIPPLVTETISQTVGARNGLADHIGEREMLLLLDNLEQVIVAAP